jgi:hypothetical protein
MHDGVRVSKGHVTLVDFECGMSRGRGTGAGGMVEWGGDGHAWVGRWVVVRVGVGA